jgi:hypothetical protein
MFEMIADECLGCRFSSVKISINVPDKYDMKSFARETKRFTSSVAGKAKQKRIHYTLIFDSEHKKDTCLDFAVSCQCILNVKTHDCSNFTSAPQLRVKHLNSRQQTVTRLGAVGASQRLWKI